MNKPTNIDVAVIGCGIFGAEIAIRVKSLGLSVSVYEAKSDIISGASANNQNRLHLGFHYPRDLETGRQSIRGFEAFKKKYPECIQGDFLNAYFIANTKSLTTPGDYLKFCDLLGMPYQKISPDDFPVEVNGASTGILCKEVVYDCGILKQLVWQALRRNSVQVELNQRVIRIEKSEGKYLLEFENKPAVLADTVINASYGDINRLTAQLGYAVTEKLYEYTAVPIIQVDMPRLGVTIMDGPFMTILPYGKSDNFLLYNVEYSLIAQNVATQIDPNWLMPDTAPFSGVDKQQFFEKMISLCREFVPALATAKIKGFLEGPRMVLAHRDHTDTRPSLVTGYDQSYYTVMAGKIDHCMWVAEELSQKLHDRLKGNMEQSV
jgi:glycine/D-amino acid oxidase-like deaminating enzyme